MTLEVRTRFNDWIRRAIDRYGFEENIDYSKLSNANPSIGVDALHFVQNISMEDLV